MTSLKYVCSEAESFLVRPRFESQVALCKPKSATAQSRMLNPGFLLGLLFRGPPDAEAERPRMQECYKCELNLREDL